MLGCYWPEPEIVPGRWFSVFAFAAAHVACPVRTAINDDHLTFWMIRAPNRRREKRAHVTDIGRSHQTGWCFCKQTGFIHRARSQPGRAWLATSTILIIRQKANRFHKAPRRFQTSVAGGASLKSFSFFRKALHVSANRTLAQLICAAAQLPQSGRPLNEQRMIVAVRFGLYPGAQQSWINVHGNRQRSKDSPNRAETRSRY